MYKILIVDDEPLARIGLSTMISSLFPTVEITGTAQDGQEAVQLIADNIPDIVMTDIKMPVMDGLELLQYIHERITPKPLVIFLTSFEEFEYVRTALKYEAYDYLVKMELSRETLSQVLQRAFVKVDELRHKLLLPTDELNIENNNLFSNRFFFHLLNGGYSSEEQIFETAESFHQNLRADRYQTVAVRLHWPTGDSERLSQYSMYMSILNSIRSALTRYLRNVLVAFNHQIIGILLLLNAETDMRQSCMEALENASELCRQYFNIPLSFGIGMETDSVVDVSPSFACAQAALDNAPNPGQIVFFDMEKHLQNRKRSPLSISELNHNLITALEHSDTQLFTQTMELLSHQMSALSIESVINLISCVVHWIINCLNNGEELLNEAFAKYPRGYQVLYSYTNYDEIIFYLNRITQMVCDAMSHSTSDPKYKITQDAKDYIAKHIGNKLTLNEVATAIGISQNYLSSLFNSYNDLGFTEYVAGLKVKLAQQMLAKEHLKIYQVSEKLGFDSPQYFSKVYKKYTGYSPSEFTAAQQDAPETDGGTNKSTKGEES